MSAKDVRSSFVALGVALIITTPSNAAPPLAVTRALRDLRADALRAHMAFLADDRLEGRETGTRGYDLAAEYVSNEFRRSHLQPVTGSYLQPMRIRRARVDEGRSSLTLIHGDRREPLVYGRDFVTYGDAAETDVDVTGTLLFVGPGVTGSSDGRDDYRGLDAAGKIVVALAGALPSLSDGERSYFGLAETKSVIAAVHGAAALLLVAEPGIPWELRVRAARQLGSSEWLPAHRRTHVKAVSYLSRGAAERILGRPLDEAPSSEVDLGSATLHVSSSRREVESANVLAMLRGSDRRLSSEYVVYTAHLDHVGVGEAVDGDAIYNGAVDNASGVAALLVMAKAFAALPRAPARSILFVATTGEEEGEIGSDYFVHHAPIAIDNVVASLNVDGVSIARFTEVVATGGANSSLGATVEEAARQLGLRVRSESSELGGSDHSPFLRAGIPALWILAELSDEWMRTRYHTPRDDMTQPLDFDAAVRYTELEFLTGYLVAQNPRRPWWNKGEFFSSARP